MITGASQADGAVLIIDALEGVRDQTRRHGYLLHLLGVKQVAVVVNKMDRVDFSAAALQGNQRRDFRASDRPRRHADGGDSDFRARRRRRRRAHAADRLVPGPDRGRGARCARAGAAAGAAARCGCRCRRSTSSTTAASSQAASNPAVSSAGDEIVIMPAGKIARIRTVERLAGDAGQGHARAPADRSASRSIANCSSSAATSSRMPASSPRDTRRLRARIFWLHDKPLSTGDSDPGPSRHAGKPRHRGRDRKGRRSRRTLQRRDQIDRAQSCRRDRYFAGAADRRRSLYRTIRAPDGW